MTAIGAVTHHFQSTQTWSPKRQRAPSVVKSPCGFFRHSNFQIKAIRFRTKRGIGRNIAILAWFHILAEAGKAAMTPRIRKLV
jgi:hypothetical protein